VRRLDSSVAGQQRGLRAPGEDAAQRGGWTAVQRGGKAGRMETRDSEMHRAEPLVDSRRRCCGREHASEFILAVGGTAAGPFGLQAARRWAPWGEVGEAELEVGAAPSPVPQSRGDG
jgi:hypothetical protein